MLKTKTITVEIQPCACGGEYIFTGGSKMLVKGDVIMYEHRCDKCGKYWNFSERYPK